MQTNQRGTVYIPPMEELNTQEKRNNPFPILKQLRETEPLKYEAEHNLWHVFLHEDCVRVLKDPKTFSSKFNRTGKEMTDNIISTDPPRHQEFREMVNQVFTPKAVQDLAPRIKDIVNELIDLCLEQGSMNTVRDLAAPLPCIVIAEMLGVPASDRMMFKEWSDALVQGVEDGSEESYQAAYQRNNTAREELQQYFRKHLEHRKLFKTDDLVSVLWQTNLEKQVLTEEEVVNFCLTLLVAGHETTTNLISAGVRVLTEHPELQARLLQEPDLIPSFVEEVLRYYPPVTKLTRRATEDVELRGRTIAEGSLVNCWILSANRDAAKFTQADEFVVDRQPNAHISFGFGIHFCLGAPLSRLEGQIVFATLLERMANLQQVEPGNLKMQRYPFFMALQELPVVFEKASTRAEV